MKFLAAALFSTLPALANCATPKPDAFYTQPALAGAPAGRLLAVTPYSPTIRGAAAYLVLYNSEDIHGHIVAVSAVIYVPLAAPPPGGRNTVAWAHPTTGIAPACAPSLDAGGFGGITLAESIPGLADFIAAGDVVAASDYQGLGVPGAHPYLVGQSEGQNILDSVRAAGGLPGADLSGKFVVWGHSQGGQAALFAGQIASAYAPELHLAGIAAAAPPTDMQGELTEPFHSDSGRLLSAYYHYSWSLIYHVPLTSAVDARAVPYVNKIAQNCINTLGQAIPAILTAGHLDAVFIKAGAATTPPWPALFYENSPGHAPAGAPLLIIQGGADRTVEPHWTESFVANACARHQLVAFHELAGVKHVLAAYDSLNIVEPWIAARFAGQPAPDTCS